MRFTQERNVVVITIITACALSTALWFAGVTSHASLSRLEGKSASAGEARILSALTAADEPTRLRMTGEYGKIPLGFEINQGQTDAQVQFLSRGAGYTVFLTPTMAVLSLRQRGQMSQADEAAGNKRAANVLRMTLVGANPTSKAAGTDQLPGRSNYFIGNDPTKWQVDVPSYARVSYPDIYKGVDLVYYGNQRQLENDFVIASGGDPSVIALAFDGAEEIAIGKAGDLLLQTIDGQVQMQKPVVYQLIDGTRHEVAGNYVLRNRQTVGFEIGAYDRTAPLVIDPVLVYSTFLGGTGQDSGSAIAVDPAGNAYISGEAGAASFPTLNSNQAFSGGNDAIVAKLNPTGTALVYSTFLGGNTGFEHGYAIAVDSTGAAYVTGHTIAADFPTTANALQPTKRTGSTQDTAFFTKLSPSGTLAYSTYLSGTQSGRGYGVATDGAGNAYVTGTAGTGFPVTASAFNSTNTNTGFLTKLNTNASGAASLVYSTFLGSAGFAEGRAVAVDAAGNAYLTGNTNSTSTNFTTPGAFQTVFGGGGFDAFVIKFNTNLSGAASRVYSTYLGGSLNDFGGNAVGKGSQAIAIDAAGNAYVTGQTASTNFPTANPFQAANGGSTDAFLTKINPTGSALVYSTYIGGSGTNPDEGRAVAVNVLGNAYVTGYAQAPNFPTANPVTPVSVNGGVFVAKFTPAGNALVYSTRLGTILSQDSGNGIALDGAGNAFVTGDARSGYPTTPGAFQLAPAGVTDAFVTEIADPTIIGRVVDENGIPISTATVNLTGVPSATTTTDANGYFTFGLLTVANNYTVSVSVATYIFNSQVVNNLQKNVRLDFSPVVFTLSGRVTNGSAGVSGVTMTLSDGKSLTTVTNASGNYSFTNLPAGRNYTVAPSLVGFFFLPTSRTFTNLLANQTADFAVAFEAVLKHWTYQGRSYVYVKLSFPDSGYSVTDWGVPTRSGNDFSVNASVARLGGTVVQAVTTTAQIYDLGPLADGTYTFTFRSAGISVRTLQFTLNSAVPPPVNPIDDARQFVKQQYRDFLNREADQGGEDFWTDNITKCADPARRPPGQTVEQCTLRQRETTSAAFFLSPEFQYTSYYVYRMYQGALGRRPYLSEFTPDAQFVGNGIVVNGQLSGAKINQNKADFAAQFVNCVDATKPRCAEFKAIYDPLNNQQYVDKLFLTTGVNASAADRTALVNGLNGLTETRASVLQKVVDGINVISEGNQQFTTTYGQAFYDQQFTRAFVQFEYFGYLRRDPDDAGYAFWLGKLNQFGGNFVNAEMVLAFISAPEYRERFSQQGSSVLAPEQRLAAVASVKAKFESLSANPDKNAINQALLAFIRSRPEFADAGIIPEDSSVWATFTDGVELIVVNNQDPSTSPILASKAPVAPAVSANLNPQSLPDSDRARLPFAFGPGFQNPVPEVQTWLSEQNYFQPPGNFGAGVGALRRVGGDGLFFFNGHGSRGTFIPYYLQTSTDVSPALDEEFKPDLKKNDQGRVRLTYMIGNDAVDPNYNPFDPTSRRFTSKVTYAITSEFIRHYWLPFSKNSFVFINACSSASDAAFGFRQAIQEKGASVYAGWTQPVFGSVIFNTSSFVFDRLLGANKIYPESDGFKQRPFDYESVAQDLKKHGLGSDSTTGSELKFIPFPNSDFQLLAPSIWLMDAVDEYKNELHILGNFGKDPGEFSRAVFVGALQCHVSSSSWDAGAISCDLPVSGDGSAGEVIVVVDQHKSNVAHLTEWEGDFTHTVNGQGTLKQTVTYHVRFRADIRKARDRIHEPPKILPRAFFATENSMLSYENSGSYTQTFPGPVTCTETWSGSGTFPRGQLLVERTFTLLGEFSDDRKLTAQLAVHRALGRISTTVCSPGASSQDNFLLLSPEFGNEKNTFDLDLDANVNISGKTLTFTDIFGNVHTLKWNNIQAKYPPKADSPR